jgi:hypothetical protein
MVRRAIHHHRVAAGRLAQEGGLFHPFDTRLHFYFPPSWVILMRFYPLAWLKAGWYT